MSDPVALFNQYWKKAVENSPLKQKSAVCVTTIDESGFPDSRFVDLKQVDDDGFVFCTSLQSDKAQHIDNNDKVALCIWWEHIDLQVRVTGAASLIEPSLADKYWAERNQDARITSVAFHQSQPLAQQTELEQIFSESKASIGDSTIARPTEWGGFCVAPHKIEFLAFRQSRLHERQRFVRDNGTWTSTFLQP